MILQNTWFFRNFLEMSFQYIGISFFVFFFIIIFNSITEPKAKWFHLIYMSFLQGNFVISFFKFYTTSTVCKGRWIIIKKLIKTRELFWVFTFFLRPNWFMKPFFLSNTRYRLILNTAKYSMEIIPLFSFMKKVRSSPYCLVIFLEYVYFL